MNEPQTVYKGIKYRIYPNKEQEHFLQQQFGFARFVYNQCLDHTIAVYKEEKKSLSAFDLSKWFRHEVAPQHPWIKEMDSILIGYETQHLKAAYDGFFRRIKNGEKPGFPKFKKKYGGNKSYTTQHINTNIKVDEEHGFVKLPKISPIRAVIHRPIEGEIKTATVSQAASGKYFVSFLCKTEATPLEPVNKMVGIDFGIKNDVAVLSNGEHYEVLKALKKKEKKLAREQRRKSRKQPGSNNMRKQQQKVARIHEDVRNTRNYYLHSVSRDIVNNYDFIAVEHLGLAEMLKKDSTQKDEKKAKSGKKKSKKAQKNIRKAMTDVSIGTLASQIEYKADWAGRVFVKLEKSEPTNRTCIHCGCVLPPEKAPHGETWVCPDCGLENNRRVNSARYILNRALMPPEESEEQESSENSAEK